MSEALRAFVKLWADTAYFQSPYQQQRRFLREGAAFVAAPLLGMTQDQLLDRMLDESVPWLGSKRAVWQEQFSERLIAEAMERVQ